MNDTLGESLNVRGQSLLARRARQALCLLFIAFCVLVFLRSGVIGGFRVFFDFDVFYAAGVGWKEGIDLYDPAAFRAVVERVANDKDYPEVWLDNAYLYPPQGSVLFSLLAGLPVEIAHLALLGFNTLLLFATLGLMARILSWFRPLGLVEFTFLASFLLTDFARVNLRNSQWGIFIFVLLLAMFFLAHSRRQVLAGLALAGTSLKPSFAPFYALYYALRRQYRLVGACAVSAGVFTLLPLILTGRPVGETLLGWLELLARQDDPGGVNSPSPEAPFGYHASMIHLAPLIYRLFDGVTPLATALLWAIILALCAATAGLMLRSERSEGDDLLDFAIVSALSMVCFYHRHYDIFLLFPGLLYLYLFAASLADRSARLRWACFLIAILFAITLFNSLTWRLSFGSARLQQSYLWLLVLPLPWAGIVLLCALLWLRARRAPVSTRPAGEKPRT